MKSRTNLFDLLEFSPLHRQIVRVLLREKSLSDGDLSSAFPDEQPQEIRLAMDELTRMRWLRCDESDVRRYHLNFTFAPSAEDEASMWERIAGLRREQATSTPDHEPTLQRGGKRKLPKQLWAKLDDE